MYLNTAPKKPLKKSLDFWASKMINKKTSHIEDSLITDAKYFG